MRFALPYWKGLSVTGIAILSTAAFAISTPWLLRWAIDTAISTEIVSGDTVISITGWLVAVAGLALVGASVLRGTSMFVQRYLAEWVGQDGRLRPA